MTELHTESAIACLPDLGRRTLLMGILNVTPDSFSDGGRFLAIEDALAHAAQLMDEGADILDIGGESTRPQSVPVTPDEEQARILPVLMALRPMAEARGVRLSVDTRNAATMRAALRAGAHMINDISALTHDAQSLDTVAASRADIVLMHMQGTPQTMQQNPHYENVLDEVFTFLQARIHVCEAAGIARDRLIADPGIGFGKTLEHNLALLRNLGRFHALGVRLMLGASRKRFIPELVGQSPAADRLGGSLAAAEAGARAGAHILRVHDVGQTRQFLAVWQALQAG